LKAFRDGSFLLLKRSVSKCASIDEKMHHFSGPLLGWNGLFLNFQQQFSECSKKHRSSVHCTAWSGALDSKHTDFDQSRPVERQTGRCYWAE
jgi:hypothetical protein